jgi:hypothetical protein
VKRPAAFCIALLGIWWAIASAQAGEIITCRSPDGKFALRCVYGDAQPYNGETTLVELPTHKTALSLNPNWTLGQVKLVWSPDSQRVAYFSETGKDYVTRIFRRTGSSFNEIELPRLPSAQLPDNARQSDPDTSTRIEAIRWTGARELLLEKELQNPAWGRAALKITLGFDHDNRALVRKSEQEKVSIIDYFLLLPPEDFEAPPAAWLNMMRTDGAFDLCESEPNKNIDEKNGYMYCRGDGAQPEFEVALFRYRDGRPLLALCSGELEGPDSVSLKFYGLGSDKRMHEIKRSIFPVPDSDSDRWQFELPKQGRTILVRARKSRKLLHKITWNGERFEKHK